MPFIKKYLFPICAAIIALFISFFPVFYPLPRQIGLTVRYDLVITSFVFCTGLCLLWIRKTLPWQILGLGFIASMFVLSLTGLWTSGQSEVYALDGLLPWNDGNSYFSDALRMIAGGTMEAFSSRRPLAPVFFSLTLFFTGLNIQAYQVVMALINAFCCYLAGWEIRKRYNPITAVIFTWLIFLFARRFTGMFLTETVGIPLGILAFILLWRGLLNSHFPSVLIGLFSLSLALNIRAGAFFALVSIAIYLSWFFCNRFKDMLKNILLGLVILLGFVVNWYTFKLVAQPDAMLFSNFADTLYGTVVGGKGWETAGRSHPEIDLLTPDQRANAIYRMAWEEFNREPSLLIVGIFKSWGDLFYISGNSLFGFINGDRQNEMKTSVIIGCLGLYLLCLPGFYHLIRKRHEPLMGLLIAGWLGIFLSVPFAPPNDADRMRAYSATLPFIAILPALGPETIFGWIKIKNTPDEPAIRGKQNWLNTPMLTDLVFILLLAAGGLFLKTNAPGMEKADFTCEAGEEPIISTIANGSYIHAVKNESETENWLPELKESRYIAGLHGLSLAFAKDIETISLPYRISAGINLIDFNPVYLVIPDHVSGFEAGKLKMCARPSDSTLLKSNDFFDIIKIIP